MTGVIREDGEMAVYMFLYSMYTDEQMSLEERKRSSLKSFKQDHLSIQGV